jgi:hypothetical protein
MSERLKGSQFQAPRKAKSKPNLPPPFRTDGENGAYTITRWLEGGIIEVVFYDPNDREVHRFQEKITTTATIVVGGGETPKRPKKGQE